MAPRYHSTVATRAYRIMLGGMVITLTLMSLYVVTLLFSISASGYTVPDRVMAGLLALAQLFISYQGVGYYLNTVKASRKLATAPAVLFSRHAAVPVAVVVASFNESEEVLEQTLASITVMDYPAFNIYLLDDSTRPDCADAAARMATKYGARLVHRTHRAGYKAGAINDLMPHLHEPYLAILDADQRPTESWLKDVIPLLQANPQLAFVQVPQVYTNTEGLPVAEAAKYQQAIFFEYICEGKSCSNAMFCCGSNVVLRRSALLSIERAVEERRQFFDETSVTEDFATSVRLHEKGWQTAYVNQTYVLGMGPETLPAYFTQQMRWAMGTLGVGLTLIRRMITTPRALRPSQSWEYLLSGTYYFVGYVHFVFMLAPIGFILFGIRPIHTASDVYLLMFIPYFLFSMNMFLVGMKLRNYSPWHIWLASALSFATFWTYMKAGLVAVFGLKRAFGVTPKGVGGAIPVARLLPELTMFLLNCAAAIIGAVYLVSHGWEVAYAVSALLATHHAILLSTLFFYFNRPVTIPPRCLVFEQATVTL